MDRGPDSVDHSVPFVAPVLEQGEQLLWEEVYGKHYPPVEDLEVVELDELREIVAEMRDEVGLLEEEKAIFGRNAEALFPRLRTPETPTAAPTAASVSASAAAAAAPSARRPHGLSAALGAEDGAASESTGASREDSTSPEGAAGGRRGQAFRQRFADVVDMYVSLEDRAAMLAKERERLKQQKDRSERDEDHMRNLLAATVEEAVNRMKELQIESLKFNREVINETGSASADDLVRFMTKRQSSQANELDKLEAQCVAAERSIMQSQQHLRQRHAAGEAFHAIDFEQLRIENQQFSERIERKNKELVELKGTSTRTVQTLNTLMDVLNGLTAEQTRLRKDCRNRSEYLGRVRREMVSVDREADVAERRNEAIKAQHEVVRVPKIEHYVAQKAEEYELTKAEKNWCRKVEIAEGQVRLKQQSVRFLGLLTDPHKRLFRIGRQSMDHVRHEADANEKPDEIVVQAPLIGGAKAILNGKRM